MRFAWPHFYSLKLGKIGKFGTYPHVFAHTCSNPHWAWGRFFYCPRLFYILGSISSTQVFNSVSTTFCVNEHWCVRKCTFICSSIPILHKSCLSNLVWWCDGLRSVCHHRYACTIALDHCLLLCWGTWPFCASYYKGIQVTAPWKLFNCQLIGCQVCEAAIYTPLW